MMRSLFAGVSGIRNHQIKMDVIGNNISNINTVAFKSGRVTFLEALALTTKGASRPTDQLGGINPSQIGLGMLIGADTSLPEVEPRVIGAPAGLMTEGTVPDTPLPSENWIGAGVGPAAGLGASSWNRENAMAPIPPPRRIMKDQVTRRRRLILEFGWSPQQLICDFPLPHGQRVVGVMASPFKASRPAVRPLAF